MDQTDSELLTGDEFRAKLAERGVEVFESQLRSWREAGLLPAALQGGSARYSLASVDHAFATAKLFKEKNRAGYVGWHLWMQGFAVPDHFWRPVIETSGRRLSKSLAKVAGLFAPNDDNEDAERLGDAQLEVFRNTNLLRLPETRRMKPEDRATGLKGILDAALGLYEPDHDVYEESVRLGALQTIIGARAAETDSVFGERLRVKLALADLLRACRRFPKMAVDPSLFRGNRLPTLLAARDDIRNTQEIAYNFHGAFARIYPMRSFAIGAFGKFAKKRDPKYLAGLIVLWLTIREEENAFLNSAEIHALAENSRAAKEAAGAFWAAVDSDPILRAIATPKAVRLAMRNKQNYDEFINKINTERQKKSTNRLSN